MGSGGGRATDAPTPTRLFRRVYVVCLDSHLGDGDVDGAGELVARVWTRGLWLSLQDWEAGMVGPWLSCRVSGQVGPGALLRGQAAGSWRLCLTLG